MWRSTTAVFGAFAGLTALLAACSAQSGRAALPASAATAATAAATTGVSVTPAAPSTQVPSTPASIPGDGTFAVGVDIKPGTYRSPGAATSVVPNCYWERDRDLSGAVDGVIANGNGTGPAIVQILSTDVAFKTAGCQPWTLVATRAAAPSTVVPAPSAPAPPVVQPGGDAAAVVEAYYAAINARDYAAAWNLGGSRFASSYSTFVADFANTALDNLVVTSVSGNRVYIDLTAYDFDGTVQHFSGYYVVDGGVLIGANVH